MNPRNLSSAGAVLWLGAAIAAPPAAAQIDLSIRTYTAVYTVHFEGRERGTSARSVVHDRETGTYRFRSVTELSGLLLRMAAPRPIVEYSEFTSRNGVLTPLEFRYEDGTRRGEDNIEMRFDWDERTVSIANQDTIVTFDAAPGTLDPGTAQIQVMLDAARPPRTIAYQLADEGPPRTYRFTRQGREVVSTGAGSFDADVTVQQRDGSSRETLFWTAPALDFLPVRIEQRRSGETRLAFVLDSVQWLQ